MKVSNTQIQNPQVTQTQKRVDKYKNVPKPYMDYVEGQERLFTNHLLQQMRKTISKTEQDSTAARIYNSMMDDEIAKVMAESDTGLGIKEAILDNIYPQYKQNINNAYQAYNIDKQDKGVKDE